MLHFRRATPADLEMILAMMPRYYAHDGLKFELGKATRAMREFLADPKFGWVSLFFDGDSPMPIGYLAITCCYSFECGGREAFVDEFFIEERLRGRGLGTQALRNAIEECRKDGIRAIRLEVTKGNGDVARLYQRVGFTDLGRSLLAYWTDPEARPI